MVASIVTALGVYYYLSEDLPKIASLADYRPPSITTVYSDDNRKIAEFYKERRIVVPLSKIPTRLTEAFIAAGVAMARKFDQLAAYGRQARTDSLEQDWSHIFQKFESLLNEIREEQPNEPARAYE